MSKSPHFYYLPVGHFASRDMRRLTDMHGRTFLWGYFTQLPQVRPPISPRVKTFEVLYAGRLIGLKRIDLLIRAFRIVHDRASEARLTIVGDGDRKPHLIALVSSLGLSGVVTFLPSMPMSQVWKKMQESHAFVLPSNGYEGWGAVANEVFTQGCVLVSSAVTGAGITMIRDRENGLLFRSGDHRHLAYQLCRLVGDEEFRLKLAHAAQSDIYELWSPAVAAERLVDFCRSASSHARYDPPKTGPMSTPIW